MTAKQLWEMTPHEIQHDGPWEIMRVPGGWLYAARSGNIGVFVPLSNELMEKEKDAEMALLTKDNF